MHLVHNDFQGPSPFPSILGYRYFLCPLISMHSSLGYISCVKFEITYIVVAFITMIETELVENDGV